MFVIDLGKQGGTNMLLRDYIFTMMINYLFGHLCLIMYIIFFINLCVSYVCFKTLIFGHIN